jgi:hypothetical protein
MTRRDPSLRLLRLIVTKGGKHAYDETFHAGINVIRSEGNSRGKSTIADLIFFSLGGVLTQWKAEAALCDQTFAEVELNGAVMTLRREIDTKSQMIPMWVFFGSFEQSGTKDEWLRLPYMRAGDRESFSQLLFRALGIPEVPTQDANITMHQLLRLMYVDQLTPVNTIFRMEERERDSPYRRQAIGDLLCGVFDERIYPRQIQERQLTRQYDETAGQHSALLRVLRRVDGNLDFSDLLSKYRQIEEARRTTLQEIEELRASRYTSSKDDGAPDSIVLESMRKALDAAGRDIATKQQLLDQASLAIEDADLLIQDIDKNLLQISQSQATAQALGQIRFPLCPSCLTPIEEAADGHRCHLCKSELDPKHDLTRYARLRNELEMQRKESLELQRKRRDEHSNLQQELIGLKKLRERMSEELLSQSRHYLTEADAKIDSLMRSIGYLDRELIDIERERRLADELTQLADLKEKLNLGLAKLRYNILEWTSERDRRQSAIYQSIARITAEILNQDIKSDLEPVSPEGVSFDFNKNEIVINGKRGYSASTLTVIKNAFHLALLFASCADARMKYPKFLLIDNVEDKGMTAERSHNFQRVVQSISDSVEIEHQIIFTTSMVDPSLDGPPYAVGPKYNATLMSLRMG